MNNHFSFRRMARYARFVALCGKSYLLFICPLFFLFSLVAILGAVRDPSGFLLSFVSAGAGGMAFCFNRDLMEPRGRILGLTLPASHPEKFWARFIVLVGVLTAIILSGALPDLIHVMCGSKSLWLTMLQTHFSLADLVNYGSRAAFIVTAGMLLGTIGFHVRPWLFTLLLVCALPYVFHFVTAPQTPIVAAVLSLHAIVCFFASYKYSRTIPVSGGFLQISSPFTVNRP